VDTVGPALISATTSKQVSGEFVRHLNISLSCMPVKYGVAVV
jgi:phage-related protein